jgi:hypothetical protein
MVMILNFTYLNYGLVNIRVQRQLEFEGTCAQYIILDSTQGDGQLNTP